MPGSALQAAIKEKRVSARRVLMLAQPPAALVGKSACCTSAAARRTTPAAGADSVGGMMELGQLARSAVA